MGRSEERGNGMEMGWEVGEVRKSELGWESRIMVERVGE